ncbi:MAG: hypothetical protein M1834_006646 [Cirrosporium novae-zelandiae]|nr:MAG: hypothetical protein M1834_006646 [Cirrosporium novae-zelandiae]
MTIGSGKKEPLENSLQITADLEKGDDTRPGQNAPQESEVKEYKSYIDNEEDVVASKGWFRIWLRTVEKANVEGRGIERVKPEHRVPQSLWDGFTIWAAANFTAATFATGCLGPIFGLGFWDSFAVIIITNFVFSWVVGLFGTFGPHTGLRQIVICRYSFGIWGSRLLVFLNLCSMVGWSTVNSIAGAQILKELSDSRCPLWAGNLVIGILATVVCFFGYFVIHQYERYSWIPQIIVLCFLAGYGAKHFDPSAAPMGHGSSEAAGVMSFLATVYGFVAGWAINVADYNVRMPENTSKWKLVTTIWAGNFLGAGLTELLGAAFMSATAADAGLAAAYDENGVGGLMGEVLKPLHGFGKFLLVLMALSVVGCNIINNYSFAFAVQNLGGWALKVPRFIWTIVASVIYIVFSIAGEENFAEILESFLSIFGYYTTPFCIIIIVDHFYFRKTKYPLDDWDNMNVVPVGFAGISAIIMGFIGAVLSMDQTWYEGVVSRAIKPHGAELGWIFSGLFALVTFVPLRIFEIKYTGK